MKVWRALFLLSLLLCVAVSNVSANDFDEEEFADSASGSVAAEAVAAKVESSTPVEEAVPTPAAEVEVASEPTTLTEKYMLEICAVTVIAMYLMHYFVGKSSNHNLAKQWVLTHHQLFESNFAHIGAGDSEGKEKILLKESNNSFKFYCSGRVNCIYLLASITTKFRHDLFSSYFWDFIYPSYDTVRIEVGFESVAPMVFAVAKKKEAKKLLNDHQDLTNFGRRRKCTSLSEDFTILAEHEELVPALLNNQVLKALSSCQDYFLSLHVSDKMNGTINPKAHAMVLELRLPSSASRMEELTPLVRMAVALIDQVATLELSPLARNAADKDRRRLEEEAFKAKQAEREEEIAKKRAEKKKQEEDSRKDLSREARKKLEEKEYRQSMKRNMKVKMLR